MAALVSLPLIMVQRAEAIGTFSVSGNTVTIVFTSMHGPALAWDFIFPGVQPLSGTCPDGGTFQAPANGSPFDGECLFFSGAATSGTVTVMTNAPLTCTALIQDRVSLDGQSYVNEDSLTCSGTTTTTTPPTTTTTTPGTSNTSTTIPAEVTTTTTPGTTNTSTTIPTENTTTTIQSTTPPTSTLPPGPCKCERLVINVAKGDVGSAQGHSSTTGVTLSRVYLKVSWSLTCTHGLGHCTGTVSLEPPAGGSTKLYGATPVKLKSGATGEKKGKPLPTLTFVCSGPCNATTHGWFFVQTEFGTLLAGETLHFNFVTNCSGQREVQHITLVYNANGNLNKKGSTLGPGD
ncbi:MAG: hypothetical protein ACHQFZ_08430 [Acidimicrobiales bacterium]